jgi:putative NADH-flavin reductase
MRVIVFGSTGGTGRAASQAFAQAGHRVTAFARDPARLAPTDGVLARRGDVLVADDVFAALPDHDIVVVSLGNSQNPFALLLGARPGTAANVCELGTKNIIAGMRKAGIQRMIVVTAFGIGATREKLPFAFKLFYYTVLRAQMADKERQEALVRQSGLQWSLVQPVGLTDGPPTGAFLSSAEGVIRGRQISRADVAACLLALARDDAHLRATVAVSG